MDVSAWYNSSYSVPWTGNAASTIAFAVQYCATMQCVASEGTYPDRTLNKNKKYDFIIVGAGSTGCVLANRLSEIQQWNILLIEAGGNPPLEANIPGLSSSLWHTSFDWGYSTTSDGIINKGNVGERIYWPRGKMIGGSSNINFMAYIQGNVEDYQRWCNAGNMEWCLQEVRRCFKKSENFQDTTLKKYAKIKRHYGLDGPYTINTFNATYRANADKILKSFLEIDIKKVLDLNLANVFGSGIARATAYNGNRNSVSKAYLKTIKNRRNLYIKKNTIVTKILINQYKRAYGVEIQNKRGKDEIYVVNDVIISAGSINSPHLLMISGVGPSNVLKSYNVTSVTDLPMVGQNLKDHAVIPITIYTNESESKTPSGSQCDVLQYLYNCTGPLAQCEVYDILAFFSLDKNAKYPDFEIFLMRFKKNTPNLKHSLVKMFQYKDVIADSIEKLNKYHTLYIFFISLLHPLSSGNITLNSKNINEPPQIFPNTFNFKRDLELIITGIEKFLNILNTTFFKSVGGFLGRIEWPECEKFKLGSRGYWKCIGINIVGTDYHPMGTCKMGSDRNNSVVNSRLKVHGVKNLRVIDASIFPYTISGNINAPCVMVGERGAEMIKDDYKTL